MAMFNDFENSRANSYRVPSDVPISMGALFYLQFSNFLERFNWAILIHDTLQAVDLFNVIFGQIQPVLQRRKFKVQRPDGTQYEERVIDFYRRKIDELNNTIGPVYAQIIFIPGSLGAVKYRKGFYTGECQARLNQTRILLRELHWRLYYDLYRTGILLPKGEDPTTSLSVTSK